MKRTIGIAVTVIAAASVAAIVLMDGKSLLASTEPEIFRKESIEESARNSGKNVSERILQEQLDIELEFLPKEQALVDTAPTAEMKIRAQRTLDESKKRVRDLRRQITDLDR